MATTLDHDTACLNCGYNLKTQADDGTCPECGLAIRISLRHDRLAQAPLAYRQRLERGAKLWCVGAVLALPLLYVGVLIATVGLWRLTGAEPGRSEPIPEQTMRRVARGCLLVGIAGLLGVTLTFVYAVNEAGNRLFDSWQNLDIAFIVAHGVYVAGLVLAWRYLATLGRRSGQARWGKRVKRLEITWLSAVGIVLAVGLIAAVGNWAYAHWRFHAWWLTPTLVGMWALMLIGLWLETWRAAWSAWQGLKQETRDPGQGSAAQP